MHVYGMWYGYQVYINDLTYKHKQIVLELLYKTVWTCRRELPPPHLGCDEVGFGHEWRVK